MWPCWVLQMEKNVQKHVRETCIIQTLFTCCIEAYCMHSSALKIRKMTKETHRNLSSFIFCFSKKSWEYGHSYSLLIEFDQRHSRLQNKIAPFDECAYKEILVKIKRICNFVRHVPFVSHFMRNWGFPNLIIGSLCCSFYLFFVCF